MDATQASAGIICVFLVVLEATCQSDTSHNNCSYIPDFCLSNENCDSNKVCRDSRCADPCPAACGPHTECQVVHHVVMCACRPDAPGHPFTGCNKDPSSACTSNDQCLPHLTCLTRQCQDPCMTYCGLNAACLVRNHAPACSCKTGYLGNPFIACQPIEKKTKKEFHLYTHVKMNWHQALAHCGSLNLNLASLDSQEEYDIVLGKMKQAKIGDGDVWLSGSDLGEDWRFVWVSTGRSMTWSVWHPNQPDHANLVGEVEHCVELHAPFQHHMNDRACSDLNYVLCETRLT